MIPRLSSIHRALAVSVIVVLSGCGGGSGTPSNPSTPPPTPTTTMPAAPVNPPLSTTCNRLAIGRSTGEERCRVEGQTFLDELELAIDQLVAQQPQIFDLNSVAGAGGYKVVSEGAYWVGIIQNLDKMGLCAGLYGEELAVTNVKEYSDNFDIINADHFIRRGQASYRSTCQPAAFTTPTAPAANSPGCTLPASVSIACSREKPQFLQVVEDAIDQVVREQPGLFDLNDKQPGGIEGTYRVRNDDAYTAAMVKIVNGKGLCARWDGEELNIKTNNIQSDNYDIHTSQGYVRRGEGAYRVTCYPAYF
jgi:hypothetical protein